MPDPMAPNPVAAQVTTPPPVPGVNNPSVVPNPQAGVGPEPAQPPVDMSGQAPSMGAPSAPSVKGPSPWQRAVHALLGSQTEYQQGPNGPVPVQVPNKPGNLFRSILAGAILGAGAGTANAEHNAGSGWGAAGAGARAVQQNQQQQDLLKQQQAQKQFENQQKMNENDRANQLVQVQTAQTQAQMARWRHEDDLQDQAAHEARNNASQILVSSFTDPKVGGQDPVDGALPATLSAQDLATQYMTNPKVRMAPAGFNRVFVDTTDTKKVKWEDSANGGHGGWVNELDGSPANMTDHTSIRVIDVPIDKMNTKIMKSGRDLNALEQLPKGVGIYDNDTMYPVSPNDQQVVFQRGQDRRLEQSKVDVAKRGVAAQESSNNRQAEADRRDAYNAMDKQVDEENKELDAQRKEIADPTSPDYLKLTGQIEANNQRRRAAYEKAYGVKLAGDATQPPPPPADPVAKLVQKYSSGMGPVASTNFSGAVSALQKGTPLSTILRNLANSQDIPPADKTSISDALVKLNSELSPIIAQQQQANETAQARVQQQADAANEQENPSAATTFKLATAPASIASRPGQR